MHNSIASTTGAAAGVADKDANGIMPTRCKGLGEMHTTVCCAQLWVDATIRCMCYCNASVIVEPHATLVSVMILTVLFVSRGSSHGPV